ncbi:hypothetical protein QWZ03_07170 [Chitinimonas viridis]|uniref:Immunity protein 22 of polymorphic toxin system n=1 Tax=Chitinimonas viridis TaxID=664880 RepID=A0ABT8B498_9NEIS|nr:hypothetical protein [Chitinimonas viridis]MDN3576545.1 hypothetical protein [Chitinimonas viridis]
MITTRKDYSDEDEYYTQGFEREGVLSIWIGLLGDKIDAGADVLQDLCGVGHYRLDDQEINSLDFETAGIDRLLGDLSYSRSFLVRAVEAASKKGLSEAKWVTAQYNFDYDPSLVCRLVAADPVFIGSFTYSEDE